MIRYLSRLILLAAVVLAILFPADAATDQRVALVIGNSAYKNSPLKNPVNDAQDMAALLKQLGFDVIHLSDAGRRGMEKAINTLGRKLRSGGTGLFYFAGHGVQVGGINYLIPIGANIETEGDVKFKAAKWQAWQERMGSEFEKAETLCGDPVFKPEEKTDIWSRFLAAYGEDNPYSDRDEALRARAEGAQRKWKAQKGQMLAMGSRPQMAGGKSFTNSLGMKFVYIEPGTFTMGSPTDEPGRSYSEKQHRTTLTKGYYLQSTEVTQGQWRSVMGSNPSHFKNCGDECPVEQVSWNDARDFIQKLNQKEGGNKYRLPTEAEWEYAARAGSDTPFSTGNCLSTDQANHDGKKLLFNCPKGECRQKTIAVGSFSPNAWGLHDMHGNVWEWCQDWKGDYPSGSVADPTGPSFGSYRVLRGGSWGSRARNCRSAFRGGFTPGFRNFNYGFRLACRPGQ